MRIASAHTITNHDIEALINKGIADYQNSKQVVKFSRFIINCNSILKTNARSTPFKLSYRLRLKILNRVKVTCNQHNDGKIPKSLLRDIKHTENKIKKSMASRIYSKKKLAKMNGSDDIQTQFLQHPRSNSFFKALSGDKRWIPVYFKFFQEDGKKFDDRVTRFQQAFKICCDKKMQLPDLLKEMSALGYNIDYNKQEVRTNLRIYLYENIVITTYPFNEELHNEAWESIYTSWLHGENIENITASLNENYPDYDVKFINGRGVDAQCHKADLSDENPVCCFNFLKKDTMRFYFECAKTFNHDMIERNKDMGDIDKADAIHYIERRVALDDTISYLKETLRSRDTFNYTSDFCSDISSKLIDAQEKRKELLVEFANLLRNSTTRRESDV